MVSGTLTDGIMAASHLTTSEFATAASEARLATRSPPSACKRSLAKVRWWAEGGERSGGRCGERGAGDCSRGVHGGRGAGGGESGGGSAARSEALAGTRAEARGRMSCNWPLDDGSAKGLDDVSAVDDAEGGMGTREGEEEERSGTGGRDDGRGAGGGGGVELKC